jgi:hypothetical protein
MLLQLSLTIRACDVHSPQGLCTPARAKGLRQCQGALNAKLYAPAHDMSSRARESGGLVSIRLLGRVCV